MTQKLFYVQVTKSGWVLADNDAEAARFENDILDTEVISAIDVQNFSEQLMKSSWWSKNSLVYHKDQQNTDISLGDALSSVESSVTSDS